MKQWFAKSKPIKGLLGLCCVASFYTSNLMAAPTKISFWEQDSAEAGKEMDKWITIFEKKNPDFKIVRQHYENEELRSKFLRSSVTGDGADIVYGPNDLAGVFNTAGVIKPVDELIDASRFNDTALGTVKLAGKTWGVPLSEGNHLMLFYNKDLVKTAPTSFDELITIAKKHTKPEQNAYGLAMFQSEPFWFAPIMGGFNAWPLNTSGKDVKVSIDTPETVKALQFLVDLKDKHKVIPADCDYDCAKSMFLGKKAAFHINGDWEVNAMREAFGDKLGIAPIPKVPTGEYATPLLGGRYLFVNKAIEKKKLDAVKKFIDFVTSKQVQLRMASKLDRIPVTKEAKSSPQMAKVKDLEPLIAAAEHARPSPSEVEMRAAWDGLRIMVQRAMSGKEPVAKAVKTGQKAAEEALAAIQVKK